MTYFHMGTHTIIGAKSFHCPVRDGKEWDQLAMVVRQTVRLAAMFPPDCGVAISLETIGVNVVLARFVLGPHHRGVAAAVNGELRAFA